MKKSALAAIRRRNLRRYLEFSEDGKPPRGAMSQFATKIGRDDAHVWQLVKGKQLRFGEEMARHIENKCELPRYALDDKDWDPKATTTAREPQLQLYTLDPDSQARLLATFDQLTPPQQEEFIQQMEAAVRGNVETQKFMNARVKGVPVERTAHIPLAPGSRVEDRDAPRAVPPGGHRKKVSR